MFFFLRICIFFSKINPVRYKYFDFSYGRHSLQKRIRGRWRTTRQWQTTRWFSKVNDKSYNEKDQNQKTKFVEGPILKNEKTNNSNLKTLFFHLDLMEFLDLRLKFNFCVPRQFCNFFFVTTASTNTYLAYDSRCMSYVL